MGWGRNVKHLHDIKQRENETDTEVALHNPRKDCITYVFKISSTSKNTVRLPG